jgi:hypothetical protein
MARTQPIPQSVHLVGSIGLDSIIPGLKRLIFTAS